MTHPHAPQADEANAGKDSGPDFTKLRRELGAGFDSGRTGDLDWRRRQLQGIEQMMEAREREWLDALRADLHKPVQEGWLTEVGVCAEQAAYARARLSRWTRPRRIRTPLLARPGRAWVQAEPLGPVLIIGAWNYPLQLVVLPLIAAIAAGNCAVVKPSEVSPATSAALARWLPEYVDPECVRVVEGAVAETTGLLDQPWGHVFYTGSGAVGRIVMAAAARHLSPVTLELGGKSPCVVLPDANLETAARRIAWGRFINAGQTCIAPDYLLTDAATEKRLLPLLGQCLEEMFGPDASRSESYGRIVNRRHAERLAGLIDPAKVAIGGAVDLDSGYIAPTVLTGVERSDEVMREEIFGPLLPVVRISDLDEAIGAINAGDKPLSAYLFTRDADSQARFVRQVPCGNAGINDVMMFHAVPELPFGGVGASGMGRYSGEHGFRTFSHMKAVLKRGMWPDIKLRYPPYTDRALNWLKRLT